MQYSPKLKKAMEEIKHIIKRYDIGASVVLHTPGNSEYFINLTPSYSCCKLNGDELRIRARLKEDFNGDKRAQIQKLTDTVNMIDLLGSTSEKTALNLFNTLELVKTKLDIESDDGGHTSQTTQNN